MVQPFELGHRANTEAKLLLAHAFETLGCIRIEFRTDSRNLRPRRALLKLGAQQKGVLRANQLVRGAQRRDSVVFSVLAHEWPAVSPGLEGRVAGYSDTLHS